MGSSIYKVSCWSNQKPNHCFQFCHVNITELPLPHSSHLPRVEAGFDINTQANPSHPNSLYHPYMSRFLGSSTSWLSSRLILFLSISLLKKKKEVSENNWIWNRTKLSCYTIKYGSLSPWIVAIIYLIPTPWSTW